MPLTHQCVIGRWGQSYFALKGAVRDTAVINTDLYRRENGMVRCEEGL